MNHVAIDIGASGGTVYLGTVTSSSFEFEEVHRFDNGPVERNGRYVWDLNALRNRMVSGIEAAADREPSIDTVGIDTWGLDFGLLSDGEVLRDPLSYRDPDVTETRKSLFETVDERRVFEATGITNWNTPNTLWQLHTLARHEPALFDQADSLLMMPQLLTTLLGGRPCGETTVASTTQMVDPSERDWATDLLDDLSLPVDVLPTLDEPGRRLGPLASDVAESLSSTPELVAPASHDTASAVAGLPLAEDAAFLSTGSWFILGCERREPVRTDAAFEHAVSNELGADGTVRLLKNVNGFFLLEECRKSWREAGASTDYEALLSAAREATPRAALVDPDADEFSIDEPMPEQIRSYCRDTDQTVPEEPGEVVRCLLDSLVTKTALALDELTTVVDEPLSRVNLGGGGVRNELFCELLADATGRPVVAGPVEATAVGNLLTQAVAVDTLPDVATGRQLVEEEFELATYEPATTDGWDREKNRLAELATE
ncbi:rhamnulokinase [Halogranum rubrum]|uniref:Rhamnulokinase n=1 Tax=Halogranum salarium B-1 TaxID=1210908 RepID=J3JDJ5_9EURY|nr:rhamnulokinase family protein [Halogranum salarium]EJN57544.1 rhamnulokinase [Halogranum salarium B-1]